MIRVLLVDDEPGITRALTRLLQANGFEVEAAHEPGAALDLLRAREFDLVVSDERMPGGSGVDFLEVCAREWPSMVRVLLTGQADAKAASEAVNRAEVYRFLWKPWDDEQVIAIVREAAWRRSLLLDGSADVEDPAQDDETPTVDLRPFGDE